MERCDNIAHNLSSRSKYLQLFYNILVEFKNSTSYSSAMFWNPMESYQSLATLPVFSYLNLTASQNNFFVQHLLLSIDFTSRKILVLFFKFKAFIFDGE